MIRDKVEIKDEKQTQRMLFTKDSNPWERFRCKARNEEIIFVKQRPQHPHDRLKKMTKKIEFDAIALKKYHT